jgi:hypothetical protein
MTTTEPTPNEVRMGDDLIDAIRAKLTGDDLAASAFAIPHLKANPILTGSFLLALLEQAVTSLAEHCNEAPARTVDRLWSKPKAATR